MRRAAVLALALAAIAGCGGDGRSGPLAWSDGAQVFEHPTLPEDRVLTGFLRNDGLERVRIDVGDVRMLAADGTAVPATPVFLQAFGKSLWSPGRGPERMPASELMRTGRIALLKPGEKIPLTVAWHAADGAPAVVDYGAGSLQVPK